MKYMNPINEAKDLVDKFTLFLGTDKNGDECFVDRLEAKRCADISVDIILDFLKFNVVPYTYDKDSMKAVIANKQHYIKVKQEIENL